MRRAVTIVLAAVAAWILAWSVQVGRHASDPNLTASLCSLAVSTITVIATWPGLLQSRLQLTPELLASELKRLASLVRSSEGEQRAEQLGDDTTTINVNFTLVPGTVRSASGAGTRGTLAGVLTYYKRLSIQRIVITGAGGSGKTVLAMELLLRMLDERSENDPLPVRFALANWDARVEVDMWMARQIHTAYGIAQEVAEELVDQDLIIPVFDGLDEMISAPGDLDRAAAAVTAMNRIRVGTRSGPMIATCRREALDKLSGNAGVSVLDAATVTVEQLHADQIIDYIRRRFANQQRWQQIIQNLAQFPTGLIAQGLSTPWRLTMAVTAYAYPGSETPSALLAETTDEGIRQRLLTHYVFVTSRNHSDSSGRPYKHANVVRWLSRLAKYLEANNGRTVEGHTLSGTDIELHELWPIGGSNLPVFVDVLLNALCTILGLAISASILRIHLPWWIFVGLGIAGLGIALGLALDTEREDWWPAVDTATWRRAWSKLGSAISLAIVLGVALLTFAVVSGVEAQMHIYPAKLGISNGHLDHLATASVVSLVVGALALRVGVQSRDDRIIDPTLPLRRDMWQSFVISAPWVVLAALIVKVPDVPLAAQSFSNALKTFLQDRPPRSGHEIAVIRWLIATVDHDVTPWSKRNLPAGWPHRWPQMAELGFVCGMTFAFQLMEAPRRYVATLLIMTGRLPFRLGRFLTWAHDAGLLRKAGATLQFRHKELQEWLSQQ